MNLKAQNSFTWMFYKIICFIGCLQIIWNSSTRAELLKFVDQQRASQGPDGSYDLKESHDFKYQALSKELHVGNVYLRVYNDQPDFEISEPEAFCVALLEFISGLVHRQWVANNNVENRSDLNDSSLESSESQNGTVDGPVDEQKVPGDSLAVSDSDGTTKEKFELIKNLQIGLTSLQVH